MKYPRSEWLKQPGGVFSVFGDDVAADELRDALATAALFMIAYEHLDYVVVRQLRDMYETGVDEDYVYISDEYVAEVLTLDPEGKQRRFPASIAWFRKEGVISELDILKLEEVRAARHELAHNLVELKQAFDKGRYTALFKDMLRLMDTIDTWWMRNFDIPISMAAQGNKEEPDLDSVRSPIAGFLGYVYDFALEHQQVSPR